VLYANEKLLSGQEVLDYLVNFSKHCHKKVLVRCDCRLSEKCRFEYEIEIRHYIKYTERNNGVLYCLPCSRHVKSTGRLNPNTKHHLIDDKIFSVIDTPEKAYALGWIASDGHINKQGFAIQILNSDVKVLKVINETLFKNDAHISARNSRGMSSLCVYSKQIAIDLARHLKIPFGKKSHIVKYPDLPKDLDIYFVRGVFDGDGYVSHSSNRRHRSGITSSSPDFLKSIQERFGGHIYGISIIWDYKKSFDFLNTLYSSKENLRLDRKFEKFQMYKLEALNKSKKAIEVESLEKTDRGEKGFGSSGK
jgi:hypothetical protein